MISIISTTYNHEKFIGKMIESVINQTHENRELLIGDDNSTDKTFEIMQKYAQQDSRIKIWKHKENKGIVENINFLFLNKNNQSEIVCFLEGDDMFDKNNLSEKIICFNENPSIDIITTNFLNIDSHNNKKGWLFENLVFKTRFKDGINKMNKNKKIWMFNPIKSFGCVSIKESLAKRFFPIKNPSSEKMFGMIDYFLRLNISQITNFLYINKKLLLYRVHENNFSGIKNYEKSLKDFQTIYNFFIKTKIENFQRKGLNFALYYHQMLANTLSNNFIDALKCRCKTFIYDQTNFLFQRVKFLIRIFVLPINNWILKNILHF